MVAAEAAVSALITAETKRNAVMILFMASTQHWLLLPRVAVSIHITFSIHTRARSASLRRWRCHQRPRNPK
jgi:hypothetical protein